MLECPLDKVEENEITFSRVQISQRKTSQNLHGITKYGAPSNFFFFLHGKWCPKEGERVARRHFHERVGESPRREKNFGTSGSKKSCFVSEIWPELSSTLEIDNEQS